MVALQSTNQTFGEMVKIGLEDIKVTMDLTMTPQNYKTFYGMDVIKAVVGMEMYIMLNSDGEVLGTNDYEDLLDLMEDTVGGGKETCKESCYVQQFPSDGSY